MIQQRLANEGFDPGTPDGQFGPRTRAAIRAWQAARGAAATGYLDDVQAELLRSAAAPGPEAPAGVEGPVAGAHHVVGRGPARGQLAGQPDAARVGGQAGLDAGGPRGRGGGEPLAAADSGANRSPIPAETDH